MLQAGRNNFCAYPYLCLLIRVNNNFLKFLSSEISFHSFTDREPKVQTYPIQVVGLLLYIFNDVIGYIALLRPIRGANLKLSIQNYLMTVKRLSISSIIITILYSLSIIIFFTSAITFTKEKGLLLVFSSVVVCQLILLSFKIWRKWIKNLKLQVKNFNPDEDSQFVLGQ